MIINQEKPAIKLYDAVQLTKSKVTMGLLAINVIVFALTLSDFFTISEDVAIAYAFNPTKASVVTAFTSMFLHAGWLHIGMNMFILVKYGPAIEHYFGKSIYIALFIGAGLAGTVLQTIATPYDDIYALGASGSISGLLGVGIMMGDKLSRSFLYLQVFLFILATIVVSYIDFALLTEVGYMAHFGGIGFGYIIARCCMSKLITKIRDTWKTFNWLVNESED